MDDNKPGRACYCSLCHISQIGCGQHAELQKGRVAEREGDVTNIYEWVLVLLRPPSELVGVNIDCCNSGLDLR